jgi:hypothetical protein
MTLSSGSRVRIESRNSGVILIAVDDDVQLGSFEIEFRAKRLLETAGNRLEKSPSYRLAGLAGMPEDAACGNELGGGRHHVPRRVALCLVVDDAIPVDELRMRTSIRDVSMMDACSTSQPGKPSGKSSARSSAEKSGIGFSTRRMRTSGASLAARSHASQR